MPKYIPNICNISGCEEPEYKHHLCKRHYEFYSANPTTLRFMAEREALDNRRAEWKLKLKRIMQYIIHYVLNFPMPLVEHFPLEHIFLGELYSLEREDSVDSVRVEQVIEDFNIPENENLSDMKRVLNIRDIETSEIGCKEKYLLGAKDLPSKWPIVLSVTGLVLLFCFFKWIIGPCFVIRGLGALRITSLYWHYAPYLYALAVFVFLGLMIPSQYNFFVERCYSMALYKKVEENADVVNQVQFVKERKARSGSYYASILGGATGTTVLIFIVLLGRGTPFTWQAVLFCIALTLAIVPLLFSYGEMALFYPVVESLKRKRIAIDLYNADCRGGLKRYQRYLYLTFLYNEGLAVTVIGLYAQLSISWWWALLLVPMLLPRFNHAEWAIVGWVRSIVDFHKEKKAEKERLLAMEGSIENRSKAEMLEKTHPLGFIPFILYLIGAILIPYVVNQLPKWEVIVEWLR